MRMRINVLLYSIAIVGIGLLFTSGCSKDDGAGEVTDINGNVYHSVTIGDQVWMVENLKTTRFRNGDPIPNVPDNSEWSGLTSGAFSYYSNEADTSETYGYLYNWYALTDSRNIAPEGWHVTTDEEWATLMNFLEGPNVAGGKLKEPGTLHWKEPNIVTDDNIGFDALPGGLRYSDGTYRAIGEAFYVWSTTESNETMAFYWGIFNDGVGVSNGIINKKTGLSVRCVKD